MVLGIWRIIATIVFLYLVWRNLKDDYRGSELVVFGWGLVLALLVGGRLVYGLMNWGVWNDNWLDWAAVWSKSGFNYYGGYAAAAVYSLAAAHKNDWKIWNLAEDITKVFLVYMILLLGGEMTGPGMAMEAFTRMVVVVSVLLAVGLVGGKYRSYAWYYSGRKGFLFLWANLWYATVSLIISIWLKEMTMLRILYLAWGLISVTGLFILGEVEAALKVKLKIKH